MTTKITTRVIDNSAITAPKIAANAVGASEIVDNVIGASELNVVGNGTPGQFLASDGDGTFTWTTQTIPAPQIVRETAIATSGGTEFGWTSLPSNIVKITVMFDAVLPNPQQGSHTPIIQLGTSAGYVTSGYEGTAWNIDGGPGATSYTNGLATANPNSNDMFGHMVITNSQSNVWVSSFVGSGPNTDGLLASSRISLGGKLDRLRMVVGSGSNISFTGGYINIIYETV